MPWKNLLNAKRLGHRPAKREEGRSPYSSDQDKILFSGAFRRLGRKTQVHPLATNDHVHNRLTHSLEVSSVGRTLGSLVGTKLQQNGQLPKHVTPHDLGSIVQATCLAHDIGNPPFGHTGEAAIRHWFSNGGGRFLDGLTDAESADFRLFEGNAQGFRVLTSQEYHCFRGGMRLTYATLASFMKYPWSALPASENRRPKRLKYGVYQSELPHFHEIANAVQLKQKGDDWYARHPLAYLMEAADDFCYGILDLEDGIEMGILKWEDVYEVLSPVLKKKYRKQVEQELSEVKHGRRAALVRGKVIDAYINDAVEAFFSNQKKILRGEPEDLISLCGKKVRESVTDAKKIAKAQIFEHPRKVELEIGAYSVLASLLETFCTAVVELAEVPGPYSFKTQRVVSLLGKESFHPEVLKATADPRRRRYLALSRAIDYVSGMTDEYATFTAKQLSGMGLSR